LFSNLLRYALDVLQHIIIPEPYDTNIQFLQISVPLSIMFLAAYICMLSSINFDGYSSLRTVEVEDIWAYAVLSEELEAGHLSVSQQAPQSSLASVASFLRRRRFGFLLGSLWRCVSISRPGLSYHERGEARNSPDPSYLKRGQVAEDKIPLPF
jgi:hypothetical protein